MTWKDASGRQISLEILTLAKMYSLSKHMRRKHLSAKDLAFIPKFKDTLNRLLNEGLVELGPSIITGEKTYFVTDKGVQFLKNLKLLEESLVV